MIFDFRSASFRQGVVLLPVVSVLLAAGCASAPGGETAPRSVGDVEAALPEGARTISLLGDTLGPPELPASFRAEQEAKLDSARADAAADPAAVEPRIWIGRRLAYLARYREALATYTDALAEHPDEPRLLRHRGHRWISVRELDRAVEDLSRAGELIQGTEDRVEPDGLPNERGIPTSTLHFNIWYHLGLAHYLKGEFERAARAYEACLAASRHPDSVVATTYWYHLTLRRLGRHDEAAALLESITSDMDLIESTAYHELLRVFAGERSVGEVLEPAADRQLTLESATRAYGVGAFHLLEGRREEAYRVFRRILDARDQQSAFGYIAAEAELARTSP